MVGMSEDQLSTLEETDERGFWEYEAYMLKTI